MKRTAIITTSLLAGMLTFGVATQSSAMVSNGTFELQNGSTPSRMIPGVDHYRFDVDNPSNLRVASQQWSPEGVTGRMTAELRDGNGNVVARSHARGSDFILDQRLSPGRYTLEV
ncbi:MAG: PPC domain-containing protein [Pseudomonadota bacterium]